MGYADECTVLRDACPCKIYSHTIPLLSPQLLSQAGILQMASPFQVLPTPALSLCVPKEEALLVPAKLWAITHMSDASAFNKSKLPP